jgi:hypothetical protein
MTIAGIAAAQEPTGASIAWMSNEPAIVNVRDELLPSGQWGQAEAYLADQSSPAAVQMKELITRLRYEYSLTPEGLANKLRESLPGTSLADIARWSESNDAQWKWVDGKRMYFRREPANLFRFCGEAKQKKALLTVDKPSASPWTLNGHLQAIVAEAQKTGATEVLPVKHIVRHRITVPRTAPGMTPGSRIKVWLPFPQEYGRRQFGVHLLNASDANALISPVARGEHTVEQGTPQRSIYFEAVAGAAGNSGDLIFEATFEFTSAAYYPRLGEADARPLPATWPGTHLGERPPHISFTEDLRKIVSDLVGSETNPLIRARRIFHWISANITYHAENEYCLIPSLSQKALQTRRGDCGVQAMLFITMCRCAGIPARWQSGWETKPTDTDMHDWSEFYVEPWGWLPADASYGVQKSIDPRIADFYLGHQDSYRLIISRDYGAPLAPPMKGLRSEPLDFQRGEVEIDGKTLYFQHWNYDVTIDWDHKR